MSGTPPLKMKSAAPVDAPADDGSAPLLKQLYAKYWAEVVGYVRKTFGDGPPDPEDAAQTAFIQYAALPEPDLVEHPRAYLYTSARNVVLNVKRKHEVRRRLAREAEFLYGGQEVLHAERVIEAKQRLSLITEVVKGLPLKQREAFILNRVEEMSYAEIARRKQISESEARRLVRMAMKAIDRALLAEDGDETSKGDRS